MPLRLQPVYILGPARLFNCMTIYGDSRVYSTDGHATWIAIADEARIEVFVGEYQHHLMGNVHTEAASILPLGGWFEAYCPTLCSRMGAIRGNDQHTRKPKDIFGCAKGVKCVH